MSLSRMTRAQSTERTALLHSAKATAASQAEHARQQPAQHQDEEVEEEVFSSISLQEGQVDLRSVSWPAATVMLVKIQIGLGVLSLPEAMKTLGLIPGLSILVSCGIIVTLANYTSAEFRNAHPNIHSVADVAGILGGRTARELVGVGYVMFAVLIAGSAILAVSIGLNTITHHGLCTVSFVALAALAASILASYREVRQIAVLGWIGTISIFLAILILVGAVASAERPPMAPPGGEVHKHVEMFGSASWSHSLLAVMDIVFAFAGTPMYFSVISEMRDPRDYPKALFSAQTTCITFYLLVSIVVYLCCGQYLTSPALGSAGPDVARFLYIVSIPGLLIGAVVFTHLSAKYAFVKMLRGTRHLQDSTPTHWLVWGGSVAASGGAAFLIAEGIPFFSALLGLIASCGASLFCFVMPSLCFFHERRRHAKDGQPSITPMVLLNACVLFMGIALCIGGTWASCTVISALLKSRQLSQPFSCDDNSL